MARGKERYPGVDSVPWKVVNYSGKTVKDSKNRPMQGYNGYREAMKAAFGMTNVTAVRQ